jgi:succinate-acetate transporter protein
MTVAAMRTNGAVFAVFVVLTITFAILTIGAFANSSGKSPYIVDQIGGWFGILTALLAWYASFAAVTNTTWGSTVLPTWPRSAPRH